MFRIVLCSLFCIFVSGCLHSGDMNLNPFASSQVDVADVYYGSFPDIPIPKDMDIEQRYLFVSACSNGEKTGFLGFSGRVTRESLCKAMVYNMTHKDWILCGVVDGRHTIQLYKKKDRYAILYIYGSGLSSAVEVWVIAQLDNSLCKPNFSQKKDTTVSCEPFSHEVSEPKGSSIKNNILNESGVLTMDKNMSDSSQKESVTESSEPSSQKPLEDTTLLERIQSNKLD